MNNVCVSNHHYRGAITIDDSSLIGFKSDYNAYTPIFTLDDGESTISLKEWRAITSNDKNSTAVSDINTLFDYLLKNFTPFIDNPLKNKGFYMNDYPFDYTQKKRTNPPSIGAIQ
jgi:hypothetical protein